MDIASILTNPPKSTVSSLLAGEDTTTALCEIAKLLKRVDLIPGLNVLEGPKDALTPGVIRTNLHNILCGLNRMLSYAQMMR